VFCVIYWLELSAHIFNVFRAGGGGRHVAPGRRRPREVAWRPAPGGKLAWRRRLCFFLQLPVYTAHHLGFHTCTPRSWSLRTAVVIFSRRIHSSTALRAPLHWK